MKKIYLLFVVFVSFFNLLYSNIESDPLIFINTMPKSGSVYIFNVLLNSLKQDGYLFTNISENRFHDDYVSVDKIIKATNSRTITQEHVNASYDNLLILEKYLPKFVLHVRDPRQALLSWFHHVEVVSSADYKVWSDDICPPTGYFSWTTEEKINWQIEHYLPRLIEWIQGWIEVLDSKKINILVTRFEDLKENPTDFFNKIFSFFNIEDHNVALLGFKKGQYHQRNGEIDEWKNVMTKKQIDRMKQIIPLEILKRFGWE